MQLKHSNWENQAKSNYHNYFKFKDLQLNKKDFFASSKQWFEFLCT